MATIARSIGKRLGSRRGLLAIAIVLVALAAWFHTPIMGYARTGASYGAHVGCSCRYIEGRSIGDCRKDFEKGMGLVTLSENSDARSITARFPLLSAQTATYREGQGCVIERWNR
jgi:hypothetical protein